MFFIKNVAMELKVNSRSVGFVVMTQCAQSLLEHKMILEKPSIRKQHLKQVGDYTCEFVDNVFFGNQA